MNNKQLTKNENKKQYIQNIIKDKFKSWKQGDNILISAGTGRGKTHFIKDTLCEYAHENNQKIIYITNRDYLKKQVMIDIDKKYLIDSDTITIYNYQKLENYYLWNGEENLVNLIKNFDYVIFDEAHYFFNDANYNQQTD